MRFVVRFLFFAFTSWYFILPMAHAIEGQGFIESKVEDFILWDVGNVEELCHNHFEKNEIRCEDDKTLKILNQSNRQLIYTAPEIYNAYKDEINEIQHAQDWDWAKNQSGRILNHLSNQLDYYESFKEYHNDRNKAPYNLDYELTKERLSLGVQSLVVAQNKMNTLHKQWDKIVNCLSQGSGNYSFKSEKECGDRRPIGKAIKELEDQLVSLYGNEPLLAQPGFQKIIETAISEGIYDFKYDSQSKETFTTDSSRNKKSISDEDAFNRALSSSIASLESALQSKYELFYKLNSVPDKDIETQKKYLNNFEILNDLSPEGSVGNTGDNGAQCRLTQRYERLEQTQNLTRFVVGSVTAAGPGLALRATKLFMSVGRLKPIFDSRALLATSAEVGSYTAPMLAGVYVGGKDLEKQGKKCDSLRQSYSAWPSSEAFQQVNECVKAENTQRIIVLLTTAAQLGTLRGTTASAREAAKISIAKAARETGSNLRVQYLRTSLSWDKSVNKFVDDFSRRDDLYAAGENAQFAQKLTGAEETGLQVALEDAFSALKPMNDEGPGKLFNDALRNYRLERLQKNIEEGMKGTGGEAKYADFKITTLLADAANEAEQQKIYDIFVEAYRKTDLETVEKLNEMPQAMKLINKLAEKNPSLHIDQLFHGGIHKTAPGEAASPVDKASVVAKMKIQRSAAPIDFKDAEAGIVRDILMLEGDHARALSGVMPGSRLIERVELANGKVIETLSVEAIGRLRKIHTPRIRDGSSLEDMSNRVYFSQVKKELEQVSGETLTDDQVGAITSTYRFGNSYALSPRMTGNRQATEFSSYNVTFDGKGLGAEGIQKQIAYTLGLKTKSADQFIVASRQAEMAVTADKLKVIQSIEDNLQKSLGETAVNRLSGGAGLKVQVTGDDYKVPFRVQPTSEELKAINKITNEEVLKAKLRGTYAELSPEEISAIAKAESSQAQGLRNKLINRKVDYAEKSEKKFQQALYGQYENGKAPQLDVMVVYKNNKYMPGRIDFEFATPVSESRDIQKIIQTYKVAVPLHRRGYINIPGQKPIDLRPGVGAANRVIKRKRGRLTQLHWIRSSKELSPFVFA